MSLSLFFLFFPGKSFKDVPHNCSFKGIVCEYAALIMLVNVLFTQNILLFVTEYDCAFPILFMLINNDDDDDYDNNKKRFFSSVRGRK